jgi:NAD(P)-dependent dehydrogenase (short-subunit alcohol dehydrogenase family)
MQLMSEITEDEFQQVIDVNLMGTWRSMKAELKPMIDQGSGVIVNIGSIASLMGFPNAAVYSASKHAMVGLTKTAAQENAPHGIRVNIVCPGLIDTDMADRFKETTSEVEAFILALTQLGRKGTAKEIADAVMYLSCDQSRFVTGHSLVVDGGVSTI